MQTVKDAQEYIYHIVFIGIYSNEIFAFAPSSAEFLQVIANN